MSNLPSLTDLQDSLPDQSHNYSDDQLFQEGLRSILKNYELELGRKLESEEILTITNQAKNYFNHQVQNTSQQQDLSIQSSSLSKDHLESESHHQKLITKSKDEDSEIKSNERDEEMNDKSPPYPSNFNELVKLISTTSSTNPNLDNNRENDDNGQQGNNQLISLLLNQNHTNVIGLKSIPNKLNDQQPSLPILANQLGAGKKPWEV